VTVIPVENPLYSEVNEKPKPPPIAPKPKVKPKVEPKPKPKPAPRSNENNYNGEPTPAGEYDEIPADPSAGPHRVMYATIVPVNTSPVGVSSTPSPTSTYEPLVLRLEQQVAHEYEKLQSET